MRQLGEWERQRLEMLAQKGRAAFQRVSGARTDAEMRQVISEVQLLLDAMRARLLFHTFVDR